MAEAHLSVGVAVELEPGPKAVAWLESLGWIRPEGQGRSEEVVSELDTDVAQDLEDEAFDPVPFDLDEQLVKIPVEDNVFDRACRHTEAGTPCDWNVCFQPAVPCTSMYAEGQDIRQCKRAKGHVGVHSDGLHGWQWQTGDPKEVVQTARPIRALTGVEAQRLKAAKLRADLMQELNRPGELDQLLRLCDFDPETLPDPDCDC